MTHYRTVAATRLGCLSATSIWIPILDLTKCSTLSDAFIRFSKLSPTEQRALIAVFEDGANKARAPPYSISLFSILLSRLPQSASSSTEEEKEEEIFPQVQSLLKTHISKHRSRISKKKPKWPLKLLHQRSTIPSNLIILIPKSKCFENMSAILSSLLHL